MDIMDEVKNLQFWKDLKYGRMLVRKDGSTLQLDGLDKQLELYSNRYKWLQDHQRYGACPYCLQQMDPAETRKTLTELQNKIRRLERLRHFTRINIQYLAAGKTELTLGIGKEALDHIKEFGM